MKIICTVPERICSKERIAPVEQALIATYRRHFGGSDPMVLWCPLPDGQSYVAGHKDDVYILMFEVAEGLEQPKREAALMEFTRQLAESFGIPGEKPLVSALDSSKVAEYLKGNRNRLKWHSRPGFLVGTLWHALTSRKRRGFAVVRANL